MVLHAQALIGGTVQKKKRAHDVQHVFRLHEFLILIDVGIGQVDSEDGVVVADIRAQQQRLLAVEQHFQVREIARVAKENAVGPARRCPDIGMAVEHGEAIALLEGAAGPSGGSCSRNVEGSFRNLLDRRCGRDVAKQ